MSKKKPGNMNGERTKAKKNGIILRDGDKCKYCEVVGLELTLDHIIPASKNGGNGLDNLVLSCKPCNTLKADLSMEEFLKVVRNKEKQDAIDKKLWKKIR